MHQLQLKIEATVSMICKIVHPEQTNDNRHIQILFTLINAIQELNVINQQQQNNDLSKLQQFVKYCILDNIMTIQQLLIFLALMNVITLISLIIVIFLRKQQDYLQYFTHTLVINYPLLIYVPSIYYSIKYQYLTSMCEQDCQQNYIYVIISCFNIIVSLIIKFIQIYFGRANSLMGDSTILPIFYNPFQIIIQEILFFITILLSIVQDQIYITFSIFIIKLLLQELKQINKINTQYQLLIIQFQIILSIGFVIQVSIFQILIQTLFWISLVYQINSLILSLYTLSKQQQNLILLQIIQNTIKCQNPSSLVKLSIIYNNHNCNRCKSIDDITICLLKQLTQDSKHNHCQYVYFYCQFISQTFPLKSLIRILILDTKDKYYKCMQINFTKQLENKLNQQDQHNEQNNQMFNQTKIDQQLNIKQNYNALILPDQFFQIFINIIKIKINFWIKLIKGYQSFFDYYIEANKLTQKLTECKQLINKLLNIKDNDIFKIAYNDILSLRVLQIYYTAIYSNLLLATQIAQKIEDIITWERARDTEQQNNLQMLQNQMFILQTSLIYNKGELTNLNYKKFAQFLNDKEQNVEKIKHCQQLMPSFIAQIHEQLLENYIQKGYSKLNYQKIQSFLLNTNGYIERCELCQYNFFDGNDNYYLNLLLTRLPNLRESILFGVDGKIYGCSQNFYEQAIYFNIQFIKSLEKLNQMNGLSIEQFLQKQPLIQYYMPEIEHHIAELVQQYKKSQSNTLIQLKSKWVIPNNHLYCLQNTNKLLISFKKKKIANVVGKSMISIYTEMKKKKKNTFSKSNVMKNKDVQSSYDKTYYGTSNDSIMINQIPIMMLHPSIRYAINDLVEYGDFNKQQYELEITYDLIINEIQINKESVFFFIISMKDYKQPQLTSNCSVYSNGSEKDKINQKRDEQQNTKNSQEEIQFSQFDQSSQQKSNDYFLQDTNRQSINNDPLIQKLDQEDSIDFDHLKAIDKINQEWQKKKSLKAKMSKNNTNLIEHIKQNQRTGQAQTTQISITSHASSQSDSYFFEQLFIQSQIIKPLRIQVLFLLLLFLLLIVYVIINPILISNNLSTQTEAVNQLIQPQDTNYYYSSVLTQMFINQLVSSTTVNISQFLISNNQNTLKSMIILANDYMLNNIVQIPQKINNFGVDNINLTIINQQTLLPQQIVYSIFDIYLLFFQITLEQYYENVNSSLQNYQALYTTGILRQNVFKLQSLQRQTISHIKNQALLTQDSVKLYFLSVMLVQLFIFQIILFFIGKQFYEITLIIKKILFLISTINENQAINEIVKLQYIKTIISEENNSNWRAQNFSLIILQNPQQTFNEEQREQFLSLNNITSNNNKAGTLLTRIQSTRFVSKNNMLVLLCCSLVLLGFNVGAYETHMVLVQPFQVSLTATLQYGQFRYSMDCVTYLIGVIKTENLISDNNISLINQTEAITLLISYMADLQPLLNQVSQVIWSNQQTQNNSFTQLLGDQICDFISWSEAESCDPSQQTLQYNTYDQISQVVSNGLIGYTSGLIEFINSDFVYEFSTLQYQTQEKNFISFESQNFNNFVIGYFCDIQNVFVAFLKNFQQYNQNLANSINYQLLVYYMGGGLMLNIVIFTVLLYWIQMKQKKIDQIKQILVLLPYDSITSQNLKNKIKLLFNQLY